MRRFIEASMLAALALSVSAVETRLSAQSVDPCKLITKAEAADILGDPAILKAKSMPPNDGTCGFLGAPFDVHTEVLKSPASWSASLREMVQEKRAEAVARIGDDAAFTTDGNGDFVMTARKGAQLVTVTMFANKTTRDDAKPKLVKLLTLAVSKIR